MHGKRNKQIIRNTTLYELITMKQCFGYKQEFKLEIQVFFFHIRQKEKQANHKIDNAL